MRHLFELDPQMNVVVSPEAYSIQAFKVLWDRDKSKDKSKALKDLAYVFWMSDYRSYVSDITDPVEKEKEVLSIIDDSGKYRPDSAVKDAITVYKKDLPISLGFLEDVKAAINELRKYFRELDLSALDDKGKPVHNANQVMNSIKSTGDLLENLEKLEIKVKKDMDMQSSARGNKSKGLYED